MKNIEGGLASIIMALGVTLFLPAAVAFYYGETSELYFFLMYGAIVFGLGLALYFKFKLGEVTLPEAMIISAGGWLLASLISSVPYVYIAKMAWIDAYFESMSGFTTTGMTVISDVEVLPRSLLFWRAFTQWVGGVGIILFFVLFVSPAGIGIWRLYRAEAREERVLATTRETIKYIWRLYVAETALCAVLLVFLAKMDPFEALTHSFTALSTGGFSTRNASIAAFNSPIVEAILVVFMLVGATSFMVQIRVLRDRKVSTLFSHPEVRTCLLIVASISILVALDSTMNGMFNGFWEALRTSVFQTVSILTTTGYTVVDIAKYPPLSTWLIMLLMAIGGGLCSTGGAVKIMRVVVIVKLVYYIILKNILPETAVKPFKIGKHVVGEEESLRILGFLAAYSFLLIIESILLTVLGGFDPLTSISGALSAQGNVGPSLLPVSARLPEAVKAVLIFGMWAGRLEIFPVLVFLAPTTWRSLLSFRVRHR